MMHHQSDERPDRSDRDKRRKPRNREKHTRGGMGGEQKDERTTSQAPPQHVTLKRIAAASSLPLGIVIVSRGLTIIHEDEFGVVFRSDQYIL